MQTNVSPFSPDASAAAIMTAVFGAFEHRLPVQPVDMVPPEDDDDILDSWLASLAPREFELILSDLASADMNGRLALDPTA
jgi:hypothetical protein